jgi:hypothetical protein
MRLCPRCCARPISNESEGCRSCRDDLEPLLRGGDPSRFTKGAVLELLAEGINVSALLYGHLRLVRARWKRSQEAAVEDFRREHGPALAVRRYLEGGITARAAGSPWRVKAPAVRMRASRLRRNALRETATDPSAERATAASSGAR